MAPTALMTGAQFAYAVLNFSHPTGQLVDVATRQALVTATPTTGTWLIKNGPGKLALGVARPALARRTTLAQGASL